MSSSGFNKLPALDVTKTCKEPGPDPGQSVLASNKDETLSQMN